MKIEKLYFKNTDHTVCFSLKKHIEEAEKDGLKQITLVEAVPDTENPNRILCKHSNKVTKKQDCNKSNCSFYSSKSGRGSCENRGIVYRYGNELTFKI